VELGSGHTVNNVRKANLATSKRLEIPLKRLEIVAQLLSLLEDLGLNLGRVATSKF
jgi:hypothetical protein